MSDDDFSSVMAAARVAAHRAERRAQFIAAALVKRLRLEGGSDKVIAGVLGISAREVKRIAGLPTPVWAERKGQPAAAELRHVEAATDAVVRAWSGLDVGELWDWARIYDGENGLGLHGHYELGDDVNHALADVALYSARLREPGLASADRPDVQRLLRLAQARARTFGADDATIVGHMAA